MGLLSYMGGVADRSLLDGLDIAFFFLSRDLLLA